MRIAIISDIHGNLTALEAVLKDLRVTSPDLILHGGDLADSGARPAEVIDLVRDLGWQGVVGNTDEMHTRPESLDEFAGQSKAPASLWNALREMAAATHAVLGEERIAWLRGLPRRHVTEEIALVHASPSTPWHSPDSQADDSELESVYGQLRRPIAIYGHIHRSFIRRLPCPLSGEMLVINTGSVSLSYDGDFRSSYLLLDGSRPAIRRVEYDLAKELKALSACRLPHSAWIAKILASAAPQMP